MRGSDAHRDDDDRLDWDMEPGDGVVDRDRRYPMPLPADSGRARTAEGRRRDGETIRESAFFYKTDAASVRS